MASLYPMGFPVKLNGWKGKSFFQVIASIQKNQKNVTVLGKDQLFNPLPLNIYRKEIHNVNGQTAPKNCNARISTKITDFDAPGNNLVSETTDSFSNGLVNTLDVNPTTLTAENGGCNTPNNCFSPQYNAQKRCRSAGMIPRKFNLNKNNDCYSTSTQQYLTSRNRTIKQNEYNYIRKGNSGLIPGPGLAATNIYSPGGLSHCNQPMISSANNNNVFSYYMIDNTSYTVTIPDGMYDVNSLNQLFQSIQVQNKTYFDGPNSSKNFLMNISYNTQTNSVVLYAGVTSQASCSAAGYSAPIGATWAISSLPANDPTPAPSPLTVGATYFVIADNNTFSNIIGFPAGMYFGGISMSAFMGEIFSNYVPLYYKPNNPGFGVQGAVEASARLQRLKYNTITDAAGGIRSAYGDAAANALAYGVTEKAYTSKSVVGDKVIFTPVINAKTGTLCKKRFIYRM
jgi:hypothetical protein